MPLAQSSFILVANMVVSSARTVPPSSNEQSKMINIGRRKNMKNISHQSSIWQSIDPMFGEERKNNGQR